MFALFLTISHSFFCTCFQLHLSSVEGVRTHQSSLRYMEIWGFSVLFAFVHSMHRSRRHLAQDSASCFIPKVHRGFPKAEDYHRDIYKGFLSVSNSISLAQSPERWNEILYAALQLWHGSHAGCAQKDIFYQTSVFYSFLRTSGL